MAGRSQTPRDSRYEVNCEFASVEEFVREYVANISRSGVFIRTDNPLPVGTRVRLRFTVLLDEIETIQGVGEVVRTQKSPAGMGVVFVELTAHSQTLVERLITRPPEQPIVARPRRKR